MLRQKKKMLASNPLNYSCHRHDRTAPRENKKNEALLTLSQTTILDSSRLKEFPDDNFEFDENGRKFSKRVEQFLLFPQCFQKTCTAGKEKKGLVWESVKHAVRRPSNLYHTIPFSNDPIEEAFGKLYGKMRKC